MCTRPFVVSFVLETYPDPVRVVSVGRKIEDLIADPNGPSAFDYSVEFCGGTHLLNSAHMQKFVVLSEEAIAKGVRRIIAVTGGEAHKAHKRADALEKDVVELRATINAGIAETSTAQLQSFAKQIYALNETISQSQIAHWRKDKFRQDLDALRKTLTDIEKAIKAKLLVNALDECKELVAVSKELKTLVREFKVGSEAKALNEILKYLRQNLPDTFLMLFSVDEANGKVLCLSSVPDVSLLIQKWCAIIHLAFVTISVCVM